MKLLTTTSRNKLIPRIELGVFLLALLVINLPMLSGNLNYTYSFFPDRVAAGEWWRILTHPFAHISLYHLAIDASAFILLYQGLSERSWGRRLFYGIFCALGSLAVAMLSPAMAAGGLCGLSGAAHGLMAIGALEIIGSETTDRTLRNMGIFTFWLVVGKSIIETVTGKVIFAFLHLGNVGTPLTLCHAGGVLAGIAAYLIVRKVASLREESSRYAAR
jgi:rhomboid family GlyGly-CTERM serine protease